jgi:hypothetical protein
VIDYAPRIGRIDPRILNLCSRWKLVVSFTPQSLSWRKIPEYELDTRLGGPQKLSGCFAEEEIILPLQWIKSRFFCLPARSFPPASTRLPRQKRKMKDSETWISVMGYTLLYIHRVLGSNLSLKAGHVTGLSWSSSLRPVACFDSTYL